MIGFFIKKNFCDGWDNLLWIIVFNLVSAAIIVVAYIGLSFIAQIADTTSIFMLLGIPFALVMLFLLNCLFTSISRECARIVNFSSVEYKSVFSHLFDDWKDSAYLTLFTGIIVLIAVVVIPFYLNMGNLIGILLSALVFWFLVIGVLSLQWYFPLKSQLNGGFKKTLKKCFIIFFDNTGFSLFFFVYNLFLAALSPFLAFLMPSFSGLIMAQNNALRLRMYKYDWMEEHPELTQKEARKQIPWDELIADDKETLGPRSFRSFIFPWKD
ncbi:MAG: hypothetical protein KBT02_10835 [Treponema sp.]|nr:hypothetical protein [Candidatus Treponema caballi]